MMNGKNVFITGGAGFIGTRLIRELIDRNRITVFDNFRRDTLTASGLMNHPNLSVVRGSVLDYDALAHAMKGADIVVHAAAVAGIDTVIKSPTTTLQVNILGTSNVLEAARINKVKDRVVNFSTSEVFGSYAFKSTENCNTVVGSAGEARWTYAVSKLASEHMALAYHAEYQLPVVNVRPFNVYGEGQTGEGALHIFVTRALKDEDIYIYGDGNQIRSWCHIDDFADGLIRCMEHPEAVGHSFNIGNARAVLTTYGLAQTVCRVLESRSKIIHKPPLSADIELRIPSVGKASSVLGFHAQIMIDQGILRTAHWISDSLKVQELVS